ANLVVVMTRGAEAGGAAGVTGACCVPGAFACIENTTEIECIIALAGIYQGDDTTCGGEFCGACCFSDESCLDDVPPDGCTALGGAHEPQTHCVDAGCEVGACCLADSTCQELREADCTDAGGQWKGAESICGDFDQDGTDDACESCRSDTNGDGVVNVQDFLNLLADWGDCP
ncbi:MAG: hypothetical protein ACYTGF_06930, partial [Planctomycetota bacterium]